MGNVTIHCTRGRLTLVTDLQPFSKKGYGDRHHDLVDRYGISVSQMTTDMFLIHDRVCN
jgi:hypothetical protein